MNKLLIGLLLTTILMTTGCSRMPGVQGNDDSGFDERDYQIMMDKLEMKYKDYIDELEETQAMLVDDVDALEHLNGSYKNIIDDLEDDIKKMEMEFNIIEGEYKTTISELEEGLLDEEQYYFDEYEALKEHIYNYFRIHKWTALKRDKDYEENSRITVGALKLYMTQDEVREVMGEPVEELIVCGEVVGNFYTYWSYEDGTRLTFNPLNLVEIYIEDTDYITGMYINVGMDAEEAVQNLSDYFEKYVNIHDLTSKERLFDFHYDHKSNTVIHLNITRDIVDYRDIDPSDTITGIRIVDYDWDIYN